MSGPVVPVAVPVLFLDLDGTVRHGFDELGRFVNSAADVRVFDEVPGLLARYRDAAWRIIAISNQGGVALGHVSAAAMSDTMDETYKQTNDLIDGIFCCTHHPGAADPRDRHCLCRKPRYGLIVLAADEFLFERWMLADSLFVGDRPEDEQCAAAAGIPFMEAHVWRAGGHEL